MRREESPQTTHSRPSSPSKVSTEVILIDDSDGDGDDGSGHYHTALAAPITNRASEAANPAQSGAVHPAPDVGIASSPETPEMELDSQTAQPITKQPGGPRILNSIEHVTGGERIPSITSDMSEIPPHQQATTQKKPRGRTLDSSSELAAILPFPDLAADPLLFGPRVELDHPPWWPEGTPAPFALLVHALQALTSTRSRIAILSIVTNLLRILIAHDPLSVLPALYLLSNSLSPPWEGIELGAGGSVISKVCFRIHLCREKNCYYFACAHMFQIRRCRTPLLSLRPPCERCTNSMVTPGMSRIMPSLEIRLPPGPVFYGHTHHC